MNVPPPDIDPMDSLAWQAWADMLEEEGDEKSARRARVTANALSRHSAGDTLILGRSHMREVIIKYYMNHKSLFVHQWTLIVLPGILSVHRRGVALGPPLHIHAVAMSGDVMVVRHATDAGLPLTGLPLTTEPGMGVIIDHYQKDPPRDIHVILHPFDLYRIKE